MEREVDLESNEVVADRRGNTPDWVWSPPETAYHETYVELLLDTPNGMRRVAGIYRKGPFWGKQVEGWFAPERISENGQPGHSMYIDGFVKGWRPYRYHMEAARPTADLGEDGELVEAVRNIAKSMESDADEDWLETAADRLILYREALEAAHAIIKEDRDSLVECSSSPPDHNLATVDPQSRPYVDEYDAVLAKIDAVLSRSGG